MLKTILVLPDGTRISSGKGTQNAVKSITVTQCVSDDEQLSVGAVCTAAAQIELITPGGGLTLSAGDELTIFREDEWGQRYKVGLFIAQKPTRPAGNTLRLTAYDRVSLLDQDLTQWLESLSGWPYDLQTFLEMVCQACGLTLTGEPIPNGGFQVQKFSPGQVSGRQLIRWGGQIAGRFCRATADGALEFAWYTPRTDVSIGPVPADGSDLTVGTEGGNLTIAGETVGAFSGVDSLQITSPQLSPVLDGENLHINITAYQAQMFYYRGGLTYEDYTVSPVEKIWLRQNLQDVGTVYPDVEEPLNTYQLTGNYLLACGSSADCLTVAASLYDLLSPISYTPCKVSVRANWRILAGDIIQVADKKGRLLSMYVMKKTQQGQMDTLECTGAHRRDCCDAFNSSSSGTLAGRVLTLEMDMNGLRLQNSQGDKQAASLALTVDGISTEVRRQQTQLENLNTSLTQIRQDANGVSLQIQNIQQKGVSRVETTTGYTFGADGLHIRKSGEEMANCLDNTGMYVTRSGETILQANNAGVEAVDVTVRNYLIVGSHARLEDYADRRTGCFYI